MVIEVTDLVKKYKVPQKQHWLKALFIPKFGDVTAVDKISFKIERGEKVGFLGPNGAGKTTTIKMLTGLLYPTEGAVKVLGYTPTDRKREYLMRIGLVMGNKTGLSWDLTAMQSLDLMRVIYDIEKKAYTARIKQLSELLEVAEHLNTPLRKLSLGQRMKIEIIGAILHDPEVLFLDEPTLGLDIVAQKAIRDFLNETNKNKKTTILLTSHNMDDIEDVCDRVIIIDKGIIVFDGDLHKLILKYRNHKYVTLLLKQPIKETQVETLGEIVSAKRLSYTLKITADKQAETIDHAMKNLPVDDIDIMAPPLDEIIRDIFSSNGK